MREKINQAARGEFEYKSSPLQLSIQAIQITVNAGELAALSVQTVILWNFRKISFKGLQVK